MRRPAPLLAWLLPLLLLAAQWAGWSHRVAHAPGLALVASAPVTSTPSSPVLPGAAPAAASADAGAPAATPAPAGADVPHLAADATCVLLDALLLGGALPAVAAPSLPSACPALPAVAASTPAASPSFRAWPPARAPPLA